MYKDNIINMSEEDITKFIKGLIKEEEESNDGESTEVEEVSDSSNGFRGDIIDFLSFLEGIHIVLKGLHWAADKNAEHVLFDEIDGDVMTLLDDVAEVSMGIMDEKFGVGDLKAAECDCSDAACVLSKLNDAIIDVKGKIGDDVKYCGLHSVLDDFVSKINKWNYLRKLM